MTNFKNLIDQQVTRAFDSLLTPGQLTEAVTFKRFISAGQYDPVLDTTTVVWEDTPVSAIVSKPTEDDMKDHGVIGSDAKLVFPGSKLTYDPETDTDKVVRANGELWDIRKTVGVPGRGVLIVFIFRT